MGMRCRTSIPREHATDNKFQTFSERIGNINIDVFHRVGHKYEEEDSEDQGTFFHQCLQKWSVLNLTESFDNFRRGLPSAQTLPQLLNQKDEVFAALMKHIEMKNPLSLQPLLELVVAFARDLYHDFYPYYQRVLTLLISLLSAKDADVLEWVFTALAYVFKFLWRCLVRNVKVVFDSLLPLLSNSRPQYVNNFAAESFAFVARKVKDKRGFLVLMLRTLETRPQSLSGCGTLLFEGLRGVSGQFHSSAELVLTLYLQSLGDPHMPTQTLYEVLTHVVDSMLEGIKRNKGGLFWKCALDTVSLFTQGCHEKDQCELAQKALILTLQLLLRAVTYKNGVFVGDPQSLVVQLIALLRLPHSTLPDEILAVVIEIGALLLQSEHVKLSQEHASLLTREILSVPSPSLLVQFVERVFHYSSFESLVLPHVLQHCRDSLATEDGLRKGLCLLTKLVLVKAPLCSSGMELESWERYNLDFDRKVNEPSERNFPQAVLDLLILDNSVDLMERQHDFLHALICLPHLKPLDKDHVAGLLKRVLKHILELLRCCREDYTTIRSRECHEMDVDQEVTGNKMDVDFPSDEEEQNRNKRLLFVFSVALEVCAHMLESGTLLEVLELGVVEELLCNVRDIKFVHLLRTLDVLLTSLHLRGEGGVFRADLFEKLFHELKVNLSSPYTDVRLVTLHIFSLFERPTHNTSSNLVLKEWSMFSRCLAAESVLPTVQDYRDKLQQLQALSYETVASSLIRNSAYSQVPLRYLLGVLFVNFQLLWKPVTRLVVSYAHGLPTKEFWEVFHEQLSLAVQGVKMLVENPTLVPLGLKCDVLNNLYTKLNYLDDKPDYINYRILLWNAMTEFPEVCEQKNRNVVLLFLTYVQEEYMRSSSETSRCCDVRKSADQEEVEDTLEISAKGPSQKAPQYHSRSIAKTLLAHLAIFTKTQSPRSMFREPELCKLYHDFLGHKNSEVQKLALCCILTYKDDFLIPYKEQLFRLIDDQTFRNELAAFRVDKEGAVVQDEHRSGLMPVIMRILFSKMSAKTGPRTGGKAGGVLRRSLVLKFLAGCEQDEMMMFVQMLFDKYSRNMQDEPASMVHTIHSSLDLAKVPHPKRVLSSLNLLHVVLQRLGSLMGYDVLTYLVRVLLWVGGTAWSVWEHKVDVHPRYTAAFRDIRTTCLEAFTYFFNQFESYPWSSGEIDAVFRVMVFPYLDKLPIEGIHSPTALLKLFSALSKQPRCFVLLVKHIEGQPTMCALPHIMKLLGCPKTRPSVTGTILEMVERLLTLEDYEGDAMILTEPVLAIDTAAVARLNLRERLNYGSCLLLTHVGSLLAYLHSRLTASKRRSRLSRQELSVLSRVSELASDPITSDSLLRLLLPLLGRGRQEPPETVVMDLLTSVGNLISQVPQPHNYLRSLAPLFGTVSHIAPRKLLSSILESIGKRCDGDKALVLGVHLVMELNAWDARWVEQPDFIRRLDAFKQVHASLDAGEIGPDIGAIIIHNCFYILKKETDLSLRDSAGYCIRRVAPALCNKYKDVGPDREFLVSETVLNLVRAGIRDKNESLRHEAVALLGEMCRECDMHPVLRDLAKLANKADPEVDFFENLLHLQSHRKTRALLKFCLVARELTKPPNTRTLTQFILPLASSYLCCEKFATKNSIVDAAIEATGVVCRLLPWHQYETVLRYYLTKLGRHIEYQKQLVRIVVAILDAFHFDLSRADIKAVVQRSKKTLLINSSILLDIEKVKDVESVGDRSVDTIKDVEGVGDQSVDTIKDMEGVGDQSVDTIKDVEGVGDQSVDTEISILREKVELNTEELDTNIDADKVKVSAKEGEASMIELDEVMTEEDQLEEDLEAAGHEEEVIDQSPPEQEVMTPSEPAVTRNTILPRSTAGRVIRVISVGLLPQLHRCIAQRTQAESSHKVNKRQRGFDSDKEDILRIPVALAAVKLLQRLPSAVMEQNLPGILMKLCTFLKSRLDSVRRVTRETLQQIMVALGPSHLATLVKEMMALLTRGFEVHVLVYTVHSIMVALKGLFKAGDIDGCLQDILEVCQRDLFGSLAEEKEVVQIARNVQEARSTKSFHTFSLLAQFISDSCLTDLLLPLKQMLTSSFSHKTISRVSECLRHIVMGLTDNTFVSVESLLIFTYGVTSDSIPELTSTIKKKELTPTQREKLSRRQFDTFIIPAAPRTRYGAITATAKVSANTNTHVLVEFGLRLFHTLLKKERLRSGDYRGFVDPLVPMITNCLNAPQVKLATLCIQCLSWVLKMDLPSIRANIDSISSSLFALLHKYAVAGLSKGDNFSLVVATFKAVTVLVRDVKSHNISEDQLKTLLLYAEQDIHDHSRQATAFSLLKAILSRKLVVPEMGEVLNKVAVLSVTSELGHVRMQARQVFHQFLMDYPLGKKLTKHLGFHMSQLNYELKPGRESVLEMIHTIITTFPLPVLDEQSELFFMMLGARLVNDEDPECRKMVAQTLKALLGRLPNNTRDQLFDIVMLWLQDSKVSHRQMSVQLCGIFVQVEQKKFERRLVVLVPVLLDQLAPTSCTDDLPGRFVRAVPVVESSNWSEEEQRQHDHRLFQTLQTLNKICEHCPALLTDAIWSEAVQTLADNAQLFLAHSHEWVRLAGAQLLGHVFSSLDPQQIAAAAVSNTGVSTGVLMTRPRSELRSLVLDLCAVLQLGNTLPELVEQVIKNLVFLARILQGVSEQDTQSRDQGVDCAMDGEEDESRIKISLAWMIRRMRRIVNTEIIQTPKSTQLRTAVFKWLGAVAVILPKSQLSALLPHLMTSLVREMMVVEPSGDELRRLAKDVGDVMRRRVGAEEYTRQLARLQAQLEARRTGRKSKRAQEVITDPERAAKRKIKKHLKKKDFKKKKFDVLKGRKPGKRNMKRPVKIDDTL